MGGQVVWLTVLLLALSGLARAEEEELKVETVEPDLGASKEGSRTDSETLEREEQAIKLDGLSVAEIKQMRDSAEKHVFQVRFLPRRLGHVTINCLH
jgi:heat shock protein beta